MTNFPSNKKHDFSSLYDHESYIEAKSPAIEPVLRLYNTAIRNGVDMFFITFRPQDVRDYTIRNLQASGYYGWKELYMPNEQEIKLSPREYKAALRRVLVQEGYDIILNLGDQDSDLLGGYAEQLVKIPNPMYLNMHSGG